ncbi:uncharacterized protein LOC122528746 [Frieseomelitta varia]|uniref:uncharacterized protein LOC122528746 n=1 Tax=Frieseomelitta varia TaxID=561572 RepID=UPI001CB68A69|nr:uncharacterized protein LOC122528746 [Frieseomelitta varia]
MQIRRVRTRMKGCRRHLHDLCHTTLSWANSQGETPGDGQRTMRWKASEGSKATVATVTMASKASKRLAVSHRIASQHSGESQVVSLDDALCTYALVTQKEEKNGEDFVLLIDVCLIGNLALAIYYRRLT